MTKLPFGGRNNAKKKKINLDQKSDLWVTKVQIVYLCGEVKKANAVEEGVRASGKETFFLHNCPFALSLDSDHPKLIP